MHSIAAFFPSIVEPKPTKFLPLWDLLGVGLGFGSTLLGKKAAMLCTASVEEVIDEHYLKQIKTLENDEIKLKDLKMYLPPTRKELDELNINEYFFAIS